MKRLLILLVALLVASVSFGENGPSPLITPGSVSGLGTIATIDSPVPVANGGHGKTTAAEGLAALGGASLNGSSTVDFLAEDFGASGFTKLGEAATGIKMKVLTGTTAETEGSIATINHGLTGDKIVSFTLIVRYEDNKGVEAEYSAHSGYKFHVLCTDYQFLIINDGTESESILSRPIVITVWYTE